MPKISVVVPVYNNEKYLKKSIQSILNQTFTDVEIILVDDGSTDSSGDICDEFVEKDSRCKVLHQNNAGVCAARNAGMMVAAGQYIAFIDSDDWVEPEYLDGLVKNMEPNGVSVCGFVLDDAIPIYCNEYEKLNSAEFQISVFSSNGVKGMIWGRLFDRNIILRNNIRFKDEIAICEDELFNIEYSKYITEAIINKSCLYHYRTNPDGALMGRYRRKNARISDFTEIVAIEYAEKYLIENNAVRYAWENRRVKAAVSTLRIMTACNWDDKKQKNQLQRIVRGGVKPFVFDASRGISEKTSVLLSAVSPTIEWYVYRSARKLK